jgi:5-methyltetrahydropteroyltriglutamate--homocysteine methyltransferase
MAPLMRITIPTDPIGRLLRPLGVIERAAKVDSEDSDLDPHHEDAIRDTSERFEAADSPAATDGIQRKHHNFCAYPVPGLLNTGRRFQDPLSDGHTRWLARLTRGPFRYSWHADSHLDVALRRAHEPVKQALISSLALRLKYPAERILDYSREQFSEELLNEHETGIRRCQRKGAHAIQWALQKNGPAVKIDRHIEMPEEVWGRSFESARVGAGASETVKF